MIRLTSGIIQGAMILLGKLIDAGLEIRKSRKQIIMVVPCPKEIYDEDRFLQLLNKFYDIIEYDPIAEELTVVKGGTYRERKHRIPTRLIRKFLKGQVWSGSEQLRASIILRAFAKWMRRER